ncbi:MAG: DUF302 domain-containing protein [Candidatus Competibacteraceae bacterium]|nr:DUF302 domain-containing protein [Candidatus Competibacteraceae bacterium]
MNILIDSTKPFERALADAERSIAQHGFSVLHTHPLSETLAAKGQPIATRCAILEVCNAKIASQILKSDPALSLALPCRVAVFEAANGTRLGMIAPTTVIAGFETEPEVRVAAAEVERALRQILADAA